MSASSNTPIVGHLTRDELKPGAILKQFEGGARAVVLHDDSRVNELWDRIVHNSQPDASDPTGWRDFWNNSIFTFTRNHFKNQTDYGDLFWFEYENYGYIARKMVTYPNLRTGQMHVYPENLYNDNGTPAILSQDTLKLAWDIAMEILGSSQAHSNLDPSQFVVHLELLKYPNSYKELERIFNFFSVGSAWKKLGMKLDLERSRARGPFRGRYIRDLYAWASILPLLGKFVRKVNAIFGNNPFDRLDSDFVPVGQAHVDGCRFLTLLASDRDIMKTEAYSEGRWEEMPMTKDSFVVFPGTFFDPKEVIQPTIHRYSIHRTKASRNKLNLTLVLGISTRTMFEERKPAMGE